MTKYIIDEEHYYLLDDNIVAREVCGPDNFDQSRLKIITKAEGDAILEAQMSKEEDQPEEQHNPKYSD